VMNLLLRKMMIYYIPQHFREETVSVVSNWVGYKSVLNMVVLMLVRCTFLESCFSYA